MLPDSQRFNLGYLPRAVALSDPQRTAVVDLYGGVERVLSYAALEQALDRMGSAFAALGLPVGERVALIAGNRFEYMQASYGALRAGLIPVMVNTRLGLEGLRQSLEEVDARVAVVDPAINDAALEATRDVPHRLILGGSAPGASDFHAALASAPQAWDAPAIASTAVAELCFTSGTTGRPKAVMLSHRALLLKYYLYGSLWKNALGDDIRALVHLPIFHGNARISTAIAFGTGGTVVIQPRFEARSTLEVIAKYRVSYILSVAPAWLAMLQETDLLARLDFSALKFPLIGSAPAGGDIVQRVREAFRVKMLPTYGVTEGGTVLQQPFDAECPRGSCGRLVPGNDVRLVDPATGVEGDAGELWIRNEFSASGYWGRPELTAERFRDGWYRSGDLMERDAQGNFFFKGRTDDVFNVGGEKVHPLDVENLLHRHPLVLGASVVPIEHEAKGQVPAAMIVLAGGAKISAAELQQYCVANGPAYACPREIMFVEAFPMGPTGKIDRASVKRMLAGKET